jgi:hypothetical protein
MLGKTFETLRTVATNHPIVVLVGARGQCYALILDSSFVEGQRIVTFDMNDEDWKNMLPASSTMRARQSAATREETPEEGDRANYKKPDVRPPGRGMGS